MKHSQLVCVYVHGCRPLQIELGEILRIKSERLKYVLFKLHGFLDII